MTDGDALNAARRGRWAVAALFFVNGFAIGSWAAQVPSYIRQLGVTEATFGLIVLCLGAGGIVAMSCAGFLMSRLGSRPVALSFGAAAVFTLPLAVSMTNPAAGAVALVVMGAMLGGMDVAMNANAVTVERRLRRPVMSSTHGFWSLGGASGGAAGGFAIEMLGPMAHALLVGAVMAAVLAAAWPRVAGDDRPAPAQGPRRFVLPAAPTIYLIGLIGMICILPEAMMRLWGALFMQQQLHADLGVAGLAFALFAGAMAVTRFGGDGVRRRYGAVATMRGSCLLAGAGLIVAAVSPHIAITLLSFAAAGIGTANLTPIAFSAGGNHEGMASSTGMAVVGTLTYVGVLLAPYASGLIAEAYGLTPVFVATAGLVLLVGVFSSVLSRADFKRA